MSQIATGIEIRPITVGHELDVLYGGTPVHTFTSSDLGSAVIRGPFPRDEELLERKHRQRADLPDTAPGG